VLIWVSKQGLVGTQYARSTFECGIEVAANGYLRFEPVGIYVA
jgi:hypothetical protein